MVSQSKSSVQTSGCFHILPRTERIRTTEYTAEESKLAWPMEENQACLIKMLIIMKSLCWDAVKPKYVLIETPTSPSQR